MKQAAIHFFMLALAAGGCGPPDRPAGSPAEGGAGREVPAGALFLERASFLGGSGGVEFVRGATMDAEGNIYLAGGTNSRDFPVTPGAAQTAYGGGPGDVALVKLGPAGVLWATYLGGAGPGDEYAYAVEVDPTGDVVITGRAGPGFPVTAGALQTSYQGHENGSHGLENAFVAKFSSRGALLFSTYFGTGAANRDLAVAADRTIVLAARYAPGAGQAPLPAAWFAGGYQPTPRGGIDGVVAALSPDGQRVLWATYLGGSGDEQPSNSVRIGPSGTVYFSTVTASADAPTTEGAYDRSLDGPNDTYVAALTANGSSLIYGTYLGGSGEDWAANVHNLAVDAGGHAIVYGETTSPDFPITGRAFQRTYGGASSGPWEATADYFVAKLSPDGRQLVASTYLGGSLGDRVAEGISLDAAGNVYLSGGSHSPDYPLTRGAFQTIRTGPHDGTVSVLSADLTALRYSTYFGGGSVGGLRASVVSRAGTFVVAGTAGPDWPSRNPFQPFAGGASDIVVATFAPAP